MEIRDASFIVVGATGGLGRRLAEALSEAGAVLTLAGRDGDRFPDVEATRFTGDLRLPSTADDLVAAALDAHGRIDGLVNASGVVAFGAVDDTSPDTIEDLFMTNTFLHMFMVAAALPHLSDGGVIMGISGVVAERAQPGMAAYSASKAALASFNEALRRELRRRKIGVIDARPGHTETGLATRAIAGTAPDFPEGHDPDDVVARLIAAIRDDESELASSDFT